MILRKNLKMWLWNCDPHGYWLLSSSTWWQIIWLWNSITQRCTIRTLLYEKPKIKAKSTAVNLQSLFKRYFKVSTLIKEFSGTDRLSYLLLPVNKFVAKFSILAYNKRLLKITNIINGARICDSLRKHSVMTVFYVPVRSNSFYQLYGKSWKINCGTEIYLKSYYGK